MAGCLNAQTKEITYVKGEKKNSDLFIKMLDELNARHPHAETITLILDNYCIHKSHKVKNWLAQHSRFTLLFLPVYSPWLNKIERLWQSLHETVTRNHCCQFMWQLLNHVDVFLRSFSSQQKPGIQKNEWSTIMKSDLKTEKKSNEITAIPKLLDLLDIKGCLVTLDAMGCQTKIAKKIIAKGADYLLAVKDNQATLHRALKQAMSAQVTAVSQIENVSIAQGHGRIELREYHVLPAGELIAQFPAWKDLKSIGVAIRYRFDKMRKKESLDYHYYISSAELEPERFGAAVRGHWGIENRVHWVLDVSMNEDACAIRRGNAAEILAGIRHFALNMLRAENSVKASIRRKTKMANMSCEYLDKVLMAGFQVLGKE